MRYNRIILVANTLLVVRPVQTSKYIIFVYGYPEGELDGGFYGEESILFI